MDRRGSLQQVLWGLISRSKRCIQRLGLLPSPMPTLQLQPYPFRAAGRHDRSSNSLPQDVLIGLTGFVTRELHKPVLGSVCIWAAQHLDVRRRCRSSVSNSLGPHRQHLSPRQWLRPARYAYSRNRESRRNNLIACETQHRTARNRLDRLLDTQIANWRRCASPKEGRDQD